MSDGKRQHFSLQAEEAVLGSLLHHPEALTRLDSLEVNDFVNPKHQAVWSAILGCQKHGVPIDATTVTTELERAGKAQMVGGIAFLGILMLTCHSADNVVHYAGVMVRHRVVRDLRRTLAEALTAIDSPDNCDDPDFEGEGAVQWAAAQIGKVKTRSASRSKSIGKIVLRRARELEKLADDREKGIRQTVGYTTGIRDLDIKTNGVKPGQVAVVAARPGMGKSSFGLGLASANAKAGVGVHVFSIEDDEGPYGERTIAHESKVSAERIASYAFQRGELGMVGDAMNALQTRPWLVDDCGDMTSQDIIRAVRRDAETNGTKVVIVDYLQLVTKRDPRMSNHDHMGEVMLDFAKAAKADKMAWVVMSQLNRELEKRTDKRPMMADMRESGSIEERSRLIIGVYRGHTYGPPVAGVDYDRKQSKSPWSDDEWERRCELLIIKNSGGVSPARVVVDFKGPTFTLADRARDREEES